MSALGQKQTSAVHNGMSALPPKATSNATYGNVRFGPKADTTLFDHLVGNREQSRRNFDADCPRGCQIDDEFMPARARHREIGGLFALENAANIDPSLTPLVRRGWAVAHQSPGNRPIAREINSGDCVARCQCEDLGLSAKQKRVVGYCESIDASLLHLCKGCIDIRIDAGENDFSLSPESRSPRLRVCNHAIAIGIIPCDEYTKARAAGHEFVQEPKLLWDNFAAHIGEAGHIAAWLVEACHQPEQDRISGCGEYNRDRGGQRFGRQRSHGKSRRNDDVDFPANHLSRCFSPSFRIIQPPSEFYRQVSSLDETGFAQALSEGR